MKNHRVEPSFTVHGWIGQALAWTVITAVVALLAVSVAIPRAVGATPYTILTSSMEPAMPPGTLVVVKPVDPDAISVGDVITFQLESGKPTVVTHRVVSVGMTAKGEQVFETQGDANASPDADRVRPVQIMGERMYFVPHVGRVTTYITSAQRDVAMAIIVVGLFGYAAFMFAAAVIERRTPRRTKTHTKRQEEVSA